jgi:hypothetical protein
MKKEEKERREGPQSSSLNQLKQEGDGYSLGHGCLLCNKGKKEKKK